MSKKENNTIIFQGKTYEKIDVKLEVGDSFYNAFTKNVEVYKDVDYGCFDPNDLLFCTKVNLVK